MTHTRVFYILGFSLLIIILLASYYVEYILQITPCPLCLLQRFCFIGLALFFFISMFTLTHRIVCMLLNLSTSLLALLGASLAARQIWLQHIPNLSTQCEPSLQYMLSHLSLSQVLFKIIQGGSTCAERGIEILDFNLAEWALLAFTLFFLLSFSLFVQSIHKR